MEHASSMYSIRPEPIFLEPPQYMREFETQSLAMFVPPGDEPMLHTGEINVSYAHDHHGGVNGVHRTVSPVGIARYESGGVVSAINPMYHR